MSKLLAFWPRTCIVQGGGFWIWDFEFWISASAFFSVLGTAYLVLRTDGPGFSYQTEPAEISSNPSLLKSPIPTPSLRNALSNVIFLKVTFTGFPSAVGFDAGNGRAG